jgi:hypothetical protein
MLSVLEALKSMRHVQTVVDGTRHVLEVVEVALNAGSLGVHATCSSGGGGHVL